MPFDSMRPYRNSGRSVGRSVGRTDGWANTKAAAHARWIEEEEEEAGPQQLAIAMQTDRPRYS